MSPRVRRRALAAGGTLAAAVAIAVATLLAGSSTTTRPTPAGPTGPRPTGPQSVVGPPPAPGPTHPNIVLVLTDDLSLNLVRHMPHVLAMERAGLTFRDYFVSDSLCCPSRASIFTGRYPHDTHVFSNFGSDGGFGTFYARGEERNTFATALHADGYATAMMGKYLNGYLARPGHITDGTRSPAPATYVPPGWSEWDVGGFGYPEFNYRLNENGTLHPYGHRRQDYLTDVLSRLGSAYIDRTVASHRPFFLEIATFAPHGPFVPAPRDAHRFPGLRAPRPASFDRLPAHAPRWLRGHRKLTRRDIRSINRVFRLRVRDVQSVDRLIAAIEARLTADGVARDTYLMFSSDNGLHTGEYRLLPGKLTAFDTDIHVPLVVVGPGVPRDRATSAVAENVDLGETFAAIGGTRLAGDGRSLLGLLRGGSARGWRTAALVEHHGPDLSGADPDFQRRGAGNPRTYEAMRTRSYLYVEYDDGEREYYDLRRDPAELDNIAGQLSRRRLAALHRALERMAYCHGAAACWRATHVSA